MALATGMSRIAIAVARETTPSCVLVRTCMTISTGGADAQLDASDTLSFLPAKRLLMSFRLSLSRSSLSCSRPVSAAVPIVAPVTTVVADEEDAEEEDGDKAAGVPTVAVEEDDDDNGGEAVGGLHSTSLPSLAPLLW